MMYGEIDLWLTRSHMHVYVCIRLVRGGNFHGGSIH